MLGSSVYAESFTGAVLGSGANRAAFLRVVLPDVRVSSCLMSTLHCKERGRAGEKEKDERGKMLSMIFEIWGLTYYIYPHTHTHTHTVPSLPSSHTLYPSLKRPALGVSHA